MGFFPFVHISSRTYTAIVRRSCQLLCRQIHRKFPTLSNQLSLIHICPEVLALLSKIRKIKPVWIELGLQTIHEKTAKEIRRGYPLSIFEQAVQNLHARQIPVIVHTILYLPGETPEMMLQTIDYLNHCPIQGIKLQLLHVLKGTDLAIQYQQHPFHIPEQDEYILSLIHICLLIFPQENI